MIACIDAIKSTTAGNHTKVKYSCTDKKLDLDTFPKMVRSIYNSPNQTEDFTFGVDFIQNPTSFVSSVRSSSVYHGLLEGTHFFKFFKFFRFERESESERT